MSNETNTNEVIEQLPVVEAPVSIETSFSIMVAHFKSHPENTARDAVKVMRLLCPNTKTPSQEKRLLRDSLKEAEHPLYQADSKLEQVMELIT